MSELADKKCMPCSSGVKALHGEELKSLSEKLGSGWEVVGEHHLEKEFLFKNFKLALQFTNKVGDIAEAEGHHPEIRTSWGKVAVTIWTHKVLGLTENDFILAAKVDKIQ